MSYPQVTFKQTAFEKDSFWDLRRNAIRNSTIPFQLDMLKKTGRYDAFKLEWKPIYGDPPPSWPVPKHLFWDSDVAKWIEGAVYFLEEEKDSSINEAVGQLVDWIGKAQQPDGYLNIHFTVVEPDKRWSNLRDLHELYNCGHLIEAALSHHQHYGNDDLLDPLKKYADLLCKKFGPGPDQRHGYPGHPELELALIRLSERTGDIKYRNLATYFITERGNPKGVNGQHFYDVETQARGDHINMRPNCFPMARSYWYQQAHKPLLEQETIEGHSVRAMYLLTSVADMALYDSDFRKIYMPVLERLWSNMVQKKMYLTGGIGAIDQWEGFGIDYFLPQSADEGGCYAETCASIGVMMLAERMLQLDLDAKYADVLELNLYNAVLTSVSLDGKAFTYVNQLGSSDGNPSKREEWFDCACCPPNVTRLIGTLGGYVWTHREKGPSTVHINVHLYTSATLTFEAFGKRAQLVQRTKWPWVGEVEFELVPDETLDISLHLRIPQWADSWSLEPSLPGASITKGYLEIPSFWVKENTYFKLSIPIKPRYISPHFFTGQSVAAVARGPLVYCAEDVDNPWAPSDHFKTTILDTTIPLEEYYVRLADKEGWISVKAPNAARILRFNEGSCSADWTGRTSISKPETVTFVPYFARANRGGKGQMRVGLRTKAGLM